MYSPIYFQFTDIVEVESSGIEQGQAALILFILYYIILFSNTFHVEWAKKL